MKRSFSYAFKGVVSCAISERNFRIHVAVTFYVLIASIAARLSVTEWALVLICIGAVMGAELLNTAIEKLCDTLHPGRNKAIGVVKDASAGAVLVFAVMSAAVGGIIFFNNEKITSVVTFAEDHMVISILIALSLPLAVYLVFRRYENDKKISHDNDSRASERR